LQRERRRPSKLIPRRRLLLCMISRGTTDSCFPAKHWGRSTWIYVTYDQHWQIAGAIVTDLPRPCAPCVTRTWRTGALGLVQQTGKTFILPKSPSRRKLSSLDKSNLEYRVDATPYSISWPHRAFPFGVMWQPQRLHSHVPGLPGLSIGNRSLSRSRSGQRILRETRFFVCQHQEHDLFSQPRGSCDSWLPSLLDGGNICMRWSQPVPISEM
jgi:hypothetical protein